MSKGLYFRDAFNRNDAKQNVEVFGHLVEFVNYAEVA